LATAATGAAASIGQLAGLRALQGVAAASFPPVAIAYLGETLTGRARAAAIGALSAGFLVAGIAGQLYASAVADAPGWRWVFWTEAPLFAAAALAMRHLLREPDGKARTPHELGERFASLGPLMWRGGLARVHAAGFALLFAFVAMYGALGPELQRQYGIGGAELQGVRLAGLPGMLAGPLIVAWRGAANGAGTARAGLGLAAIALVGASAASGTALWLPILASAIFVLGVGLAVPSLIAMVGERAAGARGAAAAVYAAIAFTGASVAPIAVGTGIAFAPLTLLTGAGLAWVAWSIRPSDRT